MFSVFIKKQNGPVYQTWNERLCLISIIFLMSILLLRGVHNPTISGFADAERHLMDGVFILDFLREMPIDNIYNFTAEYYAKYPAISIGYHPPFFPFIEALCNALFGINIWSSRLAIVLFAIVGIVAWFKLVQRMFNTQTAFWYSVLLVTTPYVVQWGWYTMAEIPALSMTMLTAYIFYRYTETEKPVFLYATAIAFSLTVWTKQTTIFIIPWFILYLIVRRQFINVIKRKETWISGVLTAILIAPLAIITFWLGNQNIDQSIGHAEYSKLSWENLRIYLSILVKFHISWPLIVLCCGGFGWALWRRDKRSLYFVLLIICVYVFFTFLNVKTKRYTIFWIPAFCLFAALPVLYLQRYKPYYIVGILVLTATVIYQIISVYTTPLFYITGYDEAVQYVLQKNQMPVVFFDGRHKNYFIYLMRSLNDKKPMYILRGDKLLTSSSITPGHWLKVHAHSREDIEKIFDEYGIVYIVVEREDWTGIKIHQELRSFLDSGPFKLVKEIPVKTNRWQPQTLKIYEYVNAKPGSAHTLKLRLPSVGQTLNVPIRHIHNAEENDQ
ncbi:MAG: glycosyltransferase family 39 protein [wastewater metagenome]|nr:glycosyltransferase family 39 protein [Candidatus Loosdrechtia aerotolerans]